MQASSFEVLYVVHKPKKTFHQFCFFQHQQNNIRVKWLTKPKWKRFLSLSFFAYDLNNSVFWYWCISCCPLLAAVHYCQVQHRGERLLFQVFHIKRCPGILTYVLPGECISVRNNNSGWGTGSEWGSHISSANGQESEVWRKADLLLTLHEVHLSLTRAKWQPTCVPGHCGAASERGRHALAERVQVSSATHCSEVQQSISISLEWRNEISPTLLFLCGLFGVRCSLQNDGYLSILSIVTCPQTLLTDDGEQQIWLECTTVTLAL